MSEKELTVQGCEIGHCQALRSCFHYCSYHHMKICIEGKTLTDVRCGLRPADERSTTNIPLLDDDEVAEIEAHFHLSTDGDAVFILSRAPALCNTVRALKAENERLLKLYNSAWLWVQRRVKHPNSGMPPAAMTLMEMLPLLPDSMRSRCVDAIKSLRAVPRGLAYNNAINDALHKIESLPLHDQEPKQS